MTWILLADWGPLIKKEEPKISEYLKSQKALNPNKLLLDKIFEGNKSIEKETSRINGISIR